MRPFPDDQGIDAIRGSLVESFRRCTRSGANRPSTSDAVIVALECRDSVASIAPRKGPSAVNEKASRDIRGPLNTHENVLEPRELSRRLEAERFCEENVVPELGMTVQRQV